MADIVFDGYFSSLRNKPTSLAGYGIVDGFNGTWASIIGRPELSTVATTGNYNNLIDKPNLNFIVYWSGIQDKPTTLAGYGITDGGSGGIGGSSMTAADILAKLLTVDGEDSGLDADLLDGQHGSYYQPLHASLTSIAGLTEAAGTLIYGTADNAYAILPAGATTQLLVGDGAAAPVWTTATGTGAPVRAGSPTFTGTVTAAAISATSTITSTISAHATKALRGILSPQNVTANATNYDVVSELVIGASHKIASGITDSGYRMGLNISALTADAGFLGTLTGQYGARIQYGHYTGAGAGTITNAFGLQLEYLTSGSATITNAYSIYSTGAAKMYHAGNVGIGFTAPLSKLSIDGGLHVGGDSDAGDNNILIDGYVRSCITPYVSQLTGWNISQAGAGDFRYLYTDELHAKAFIADLEQALAGGQIICKSVSLLGAAFTAPAAGGAVTLTMKDLPSAEDMAVFESGDYIRIRTFSRAAGSLTIADCWGIVTSYTDQANKLQTWTFTRGSGANAGSMAQNTVVAIDSIVLDYGVTGNGFYEVNAIDGLYGVNSPYSQVVTWTTSPVAANQVCRVRLGNLKGLPWGVANEYGLYAGDGITAASKYLRISNEAVEIRNVPIKMYDGAINTVLLCSTTPSFAMGSTLPTAYMTGNGIWMGKDNAYKMRVGTVSGGALVKGFSWDGTNFSILGVATIGTSAIDDSNCTISGSALSNSSYGANGGTTYINYMGYQGGSTYTRNFIVGNGTSNTGLLLYCVGGGADNPMGTQKRVGICTNLSPDSTFQVATLNGAGLKINYNEGGTNYIYGSTTTNNIITDAITANGIVTANAAITANAVISFGVNGFISAKNCPQLINKIASANARNAHNDEVSLESTNWTKMKTITLINGLLGQQRFLFDLKMAGGEGVGYGKIYRNGAALGTQQTSTTDYVTKSEDITRDWSPGDTCELWLYSTLGTTAYAQNFRIAYDDSPVVGVPSSNS